MTIDRDYELMREERDAAEAALAEARGRERALHGHLNALARDVNAYLKDIDSRGAAFLVVCRLADVEAALALPYSPQGRPEKDLKAVAPGLKSEEGT